MIETRLQPFAFVIFFLFFYSNNACSQFKDTTFYVQYPVKGYVFINSKEKVSIKGLNFLNSDSLILFEKGASQNAIRVYKNMARLSNVNPRIEAITNINILKDNRNATLKGASVGAVIGYGLGYILGYGSYDNKFDRTQEENDDRRKTRAGLYGLAGAAPVALTGALVGSIILRKKFPIRGSKEKLTEALQKIY